MFDFPKKNHARKEPEPKQFLLGPDLSDATKDILREHKVTTGRVVQGGMVSVSVSPECAALLEKRPDVISFEKLFSNPKFNTIRF